MVKHDENQDLRSVGRIAKVNPADKTISCSKNAIVGIHMWGKIDFLTKYCGWHFIWDNTIVSVDKEIKVKVKKNANIKLQA